MDDSNPKISIIFPSYNGEKFLERNLNSIKNLNNLKEIELIIIDNKSKDSSLEIINSYNSEINVKLIKQNNNLGFAKACNIGALNARGEFIFTTNQDVIFPPEFFTKLKKIYYQYKTRQEIIISPALVFEKNGLHYFGAKIHFLGFSYTPDIRKKLPEQKIIKTTQRFSGGSFFIKKDLFLRMHGFDAKLFMYCEDTDLSLRFLRQGLKIYTTSDPYLIHQKHEWTFNDFRYFLLERNRFIIFFKNIDDFKKTLPFFLLTEIILIFQSIIIKKFNLRVRIYIELLKRRKFIKRLREQSKRELPLFPYQNLSKTIDSILLETSKNNLGFNKFLKIYNFLLRLF